MFITTVVIYSLSVICIIASIFIVFCILKTQERKYKNVAHISWVSAFIMMIIGSLSACIFTLISLLTENHCMILNYTEKQNSVNGLQDLYPTSIVPLLDTCLFGLEKEATVPLGIDDQVKAMTKLQASSQDFVSASADTTWDDSVWVNYKTNQLDSW